MILLTFFVGFFFFFFFLRTDEINCKAKKTYLICRRNYISSLKVEDNVYHEDDIDDEIETDP